MENNQELSLEQRVEQLFEAQSLDRATLESLSDEELMLLFQRDVRLAFDILVERYKNPLMNYIFRFTGNSEDSADLLQDTFIRVYRKKHLYKTIARFSTWVYTIAGNLAKSELRRGHRKYLTPIERKRSDDEEYSIPLPDHDPLPDRSADKNIVFERIQKALLQIPEVFREAVVLRDIQELSYEEIAEITDMPIGTVKSRINRGRSQLQELLKDLYD
ncbi:MAG: sigma-70 family RNA polymerase sigma factor [Bacteroidota bacterium]|jgi:RNA polymerase sigma-70 factor (ECF subfamily)|nr:sigma-70 family RNA polymerase sigma factor [Bacteroidota bacterium]